jgi:hypothetical protein
MRSIHDAFAGTDDLPRASLLDASSIVIEKGYPKKSLGGGCDVRDNSAVSSRSDD